MDEGISNEARNTSEESDAEVKPFKKAKYAWQIKGKARWKNKRARNRKLAPSSGQKNDEKKEENEETHTQTQENTVQETPKTAENNPETANYASPGHAEPQNVNLSSDVDGFLSMLNPAPATNNLRKWQTKQVAKAIIDNAINKVLEDMGVIPLPADAFDFHLVDSDINAQNIEDKGVSEAIKQQGLHRRRHLEAESENTTTCTYWLHWNADEKEAAEVKLPVQDNVLDAAVSFAINEKGLGVLSHGSN